jgi:hypothetical protein
MNRESLPACSASMYFGGRVLQLLISRTPSSVRPFQSSTYQPFVWVLEPSASSPGYLFHGLCLKDVLAGRRRWLCVYRRQIRQDEGVAAQCEIESQSHPRRCALSPLLAYMRSLACTRNRSRSPRNGYLCKQACRGRLPDLKMSVRHQRLTSVGQPGDPPHPSPSVKVCARTEHGGDLQCWMIEE